MAQTSVSTSRAFGIELDVAKSLRQGTILNILDWRSGNEPRVMIDADGSMSRYKITSVKTWKRSPGEVEIHVQRGLREFGILKADDLDRIRIGSTVPEMPQE